MVEVKNREITIRLSGDVEDLHDMQSSLVQLIQNFDDGCGGASNEPIFSAMSLLDAMRPNLEQLKKGLDTTETNQ